VLIVTIISVPGPSNGDDRKTADSRSIDVIAMSKLEPIETISKRNPKIPARITVISKSISTTHAMVA
jgi:hypothetical protein